MTGRDALRAQVVDWIARLPLSGEPEIARLVGIHEHDARGLAQDLVRLGWTESLEPGSRELEARRRYVVRAQAVPALADALGVAKVERELPVRLRDTLHRVTRFEITAGVNRLLADLADQMRRAGHGELVDARSLPLGVAPREQWWLAGASGYGCLRCKALWAPFLVAWDRAAAPDEHRRARVRAWVRAGTAAARRWGAEGLPTMLLVCPSERERAVWEQALLKRREDDPFTVPSVLLTTREALRTHGVGGDIWRRPGDSSSSPLIGTISWGTEPPVTTPWFSDCPDRLADLTHQQGESLRAWALNEVTPRAGGPLWRHIGAVAVTFGPGDRAIVEWLARFPLLSAADLAAFTNESAALVERRLEWVIRCDLVRTAPDRTAVDQRKGVRMEHDNEARYVLTEKGIRFLAERAGVSPDALRGNGGIKPRKRWAGDQQHGVRHVEHTIGTNRFLAQLATDARAKGGRLLEARNDAESACGFLDQHGRDSAIRPDAAGIVDVAGIRLPFLLEYDRGTLDAGDFRGKFEGYRRYYTDQHWRAAFEREPVLLFVCVDGRAERRVLDGARSGSPTIPVLATTEVRCGRTGAFEAIWQAADGEYRKLLDKPSAPRSQGHRDAG